MGNLILLAGPNGSGKTTYYEQVLKEKYPDYFYINADAIKKDTEYYRALDLTKYGIEESQEVFDSYIKNNYTPNFTLYGGLYVVSKEQFNTYWWIEDYFIMVITTFILEKLVEQGANIIYETVFSHESKVDLIKSIKEKGYEIDLYYICTDYPLINIMNVAKRVKEGGHAVPEDKIVSRYYRSLDNLLKSIILEDGKYFSNYTYINSDYRNRFTSPNDAYWLDNLYDKYYAIKSKQDD